MSEAKTDFTVEQIDVQIQNQIKEMGVRQRNGDYIEAQACRTKIQQLKKDYELRRLSELKRKQKKEAKKLDNEYKQEMSEFDESYAKREDEIRGEFSKLMGEMQQKHEEERSKNQEELNENLPSKLKESSELLNLKRIEGQMAKQKNFLEAHQIKERRLELYEVELLAWNQARDQKIQTALKTLQTRQDIEQQALKQREQIAFEELEKKKKKQLKVLKLKFQNANKELKMQHDKEIICHKGKFKSKGGQATSPSMSRLKTCI